MNILIKLLVLLLLLGCSETYFASTFTTPDGTELTVDSCTQEFIDFLNLSNEFHLLEAEDIRLLSRGETPKNLSEYEKSIRKGNDLVKEYNDSLKKGDNRNWIRNVKDRISFVEDRLNLSRERVYSREKFDRLLKEAKKLQWENELLLADSYQFSANLCHLFKEGYRMTNVGKDKAAEIKQLKEEYNHLVDDYNRLEEESIGSITEIIRISSEMVDINKKIRGIEDSFLEKERGE